MVKKKATCTKETTQKLLITISSDDHRITRPHTLHVSLIQPVLLCYIFQFLFTIARGATLVKWLKRK